MRLQFPQRVSIPKTILFATAIAFVQHFEHTRTTFSLMFAAFVVLSAFTFNIAGGFRRLIGAYVFWFAMLSCIVGVTWKAVLREPADSNLIQPVLDITAYTVSMLMLLLVVQLNKRFDFRANSIAAAVGSETLNYSVVGMGCIVSGLSLRLLNLVIPAYPGSILSLLNQLDVFLPLGIMFSTIGAIDDSHGHRGLNFSAALGMIVILFLGILGFSKQALLTPGVCWIVAAAFMRFKLRRIHMIALAIFIVFGLYFVPTWAVGRDEVANDADFSTRFESSIYFLQHFDFLKEQRQKAEDLDAAFGTTGYFQEHQGLLDRLTILAADDSLLNFSALGHYDGFAPLALDFENWIPHFLIPDKPPIISGNSYAHEMGAIPADDYLTGISFSPVAEAFHLGGWTGIFLILPAVWFLMFETIDFVAGDLRRSPWGLLLILYFAHSAAESLVSGLIFYTFFGNLSMTFAIIFCTRMAPIFGSLFYGTQNSARKKPLQVLSRA